MTRTIILAILLCGCPLSPELPSRLSSDATPCERACAVLERDRCIGYRGSPGDDGWYGTDDDVSCVQVCSDYAAVSDHERVQLELECLAGSESCTQVELCIEAWEGES